MFTRIFENLPRRHLLEVTTTLCPLLMISLSNVGYITYHEIQRESSGVVCRVKKEYVEEYEKGKSKYSIQTMVVSILAIFSYRYAAMRA